MEVRRLPEWVETDYDLELYHHGVKGQIRGRRRYQNKDGSLTPLGRIHYGVVGKARTFLYEHPEANDAYKSAKREARRTIEDTKTAARNIRSEATGTYNKVRETVPEAYNQARNTARNTANDARFAVDEHVGVGREINRFDTSQRRASNLSEVGTGVSRRAQINGRHSIRYDESMDTISQSPLTMRGKNLVSSSSLRDQTIDAIRDREVTQIGRFYTEQFYKGTGGMGISSHNYGDSRVLKRHYARDGRSQTGAISPNTYYRNPRQAHLDAILNEEEYRQQTVVRNLRKKGASREEIQKRMAAIEKYYDKQYDKIKRRKNSSFN